MSALVNHFGPDISSYSRAQALEDGVLIDVTKIAREAGIRFPVALTAAAHGDCVEWTDEDTKRTRVPQDEDGRLWDVVWMASMAMRLRRKLSESAALVTLVRVPRDGSSRQAVETHLVAIVGPGDEAEPVITICTTDEYETRGD